MPHVAHDLARVLEIVDGALQPAEVRIGQVERNAEHGLHVGAAPFVGEIADRPELVEPAPLELVVELPHVRLDGRSLEPQAELADPLAEHAAQFGIEGFEGRHHSIIGVVQFREPRPSKGLDGTRAHG